MRLTTQLGLALRLSTHGGIIPLPHMFSWCGTYLSTGPALPLPLLSCFMPSCYKYGPSIFSHC